MMRRMLCIALFLVALDSVIILVVSVIVVVVVVVVVAAAVAYFDVAAAAVVVVAAVTESVAVANVALRSSDAFCTNGNQQTASYANTAGVVYLCFSRYN